MKLYLKPCVYYLPHINHDGTSDIYHQFGFNQEWKHVNPQLHQICLIVNGCIHGLTEEMNINHFSQFQ